MGWVGKPHSVRAWLVALPKSLTVSKRVPSKSNIASFVMIPVIYSAFSKPLYSPLDSYGTPVFIQAGIGAPFR